MVLPGGGESGLTELIPAGLVSVGDDETVSMLLIAPERSGATGLETFPRVKTAWRGCDAAIRDVNNHKIHLSACLSELFALSRS